MTEPSPKNSNEAFEKALQESQTAKFLLRLYVAGNTLKSAQAIRNLRQVCEEHLQGRYQLEVIDIHQQPSAARMDQIIATPTLIKYLPLPLRKIVGDLSETDRILIGLELVKVEE